MEPIVSVRGLRKTYKSGQVALDSVDLAIAPGEIFALLGPNGAGKTTLISIVCGIVTPTSGEVRVGGHDILSGYRRTRAMIGLVPQELATDAFERVIATVSFSRGLFGKPPAPDYIRQLLGDLSLWDKRDAKIMELSGGMKRRVLIAKALAHEPQVLFLDEPTAGVDVNLRRDMWALVRRLRERGVTIVLTTHYIEEAQEMADRVGVIADGRILVVDDKDALMAKLGKRRLTLTLDEPLAAIPPELAEWALESGGEGQRLTYTFDARAERTGIPSLLRKLGELGIGFQDLETSRSSLEDIFVDLVENPGRAPRAAAA